jgi:plasmid stabilization system protein ParE
MASIDIAPRALEDIERLTDFLLSADPTNAATTTVLLMGGLQILATHPLVGRQVEQGLRELVISRGRSGYLALYRYDLSRDHVRILAVRHQRELGFVQ